MESKCKAKTTREGPACGESLGALESQRIGPDVYGGANIYSEGAERRSSATPSAHAREPRVVLERMELGRRGSDASLVPERMEQEAASDSSLVSAAEPNARSRFWEGRKRRILAEQSDSSGGESSNPGPRTRQRGRLPTTGQNVGLHAAKKQLLLAEKREEQRRQAAEELEAKVASYRKRTPGQVEEFSSQTADELRSRIQDEAALIGTIVNKSRNIKSDLVRDLRNAVATITGATAEISTRTADDEVRRLRSQNASLKAELSCFRKELESLRLEMGSLRGQSAAPPRETEGCSAPDRSTPKRRRIEPEAAPSLEEICRQEGSQADATAAVDAAAGAEAAAATDVAAAGAQTEGQQAVTKIASSAHGSGSRDPDARGCGQGRGV